MLVVSKLQKWGIGMQDDLEDIGQKLIDILDDMQRLLNKRVHTAAKSTLDPILQRMLNSMGIDLSQLRGTTSGSGAIDPYSVLGLERSAPDDEVKKRYIELVHALHPDKSGTPATGRFFQMVQMAYEIIRREKGWQ